MSRVAELLDEALREAGAPTGRLHLAAVQRKASRRLLEGAAMHYRKAADLLDEAAALLPDRPKGDPDQ